MDMTEDQPLAPCGCRSGCQHRDHPQYAPQRSCRLGYVRPTSPERGKTRPCALDDPHGAHVRTTGAWCPGLDEDEDEKESTVPMIENTPMTMTLVLEVDGHRLEFAEAVRNIQGARYDGADPRDQGYSTDNSLEAKIRAHVDTVADVLVARAQQTARRLYPVADDARAGG
jgi:hypothetical protein